MSVTIRQLASELGVSRQTVSGILSGRSELYKPETRRRVIAEAKRLNYRPNGAAKAIFSRRMRNIAVLVVNTDDAAPEFVHYNAPTFELILGANARCQRDQYTLSLVSSNEVGRHHASESRVFKEHLIDGMIVIGKLGGVTEQRVESLGVPVVWLESNTWHERLCLRRDEVHAGRLATEKAIEAGYRRVLYVGLPPMPVGDHFSAQQRWDGVTQAARDAGVDLQSVIAQTGQHETLDLATIRGAVGRQTAVVAYSGQMAQWICNQLARDGRLPGRDFGLCACEDDAMLLRTMPELARVGFDRFRLGQQAADMMLNVIESGRENASPDSLSSLLIQDQWMRGTTLVGV